MLTVEVDGIFADHHASALDRPYQSTVRTDGRADLHDVAEPLGVLDDRARVARLVDHRDEPQLSELVALERRPRLFLPDGAPRARRTERVAATGGVVRDVTARLDRARELRVGVGGVFGVHRHRGHREQHEPDSTPAPSIHAGFPAFSFFFFSSMSRWRSASSRNRNVVAVHAASSIMRSPSILGFVSWMFVTLTIRSSRFTRSRKSATSW